MLHVTRICAAIFFSATSSFYICLYVAVLVNIGDIGIHGKLWVHIWRRTSLPSRVQTLFVKDK